MSVLAACDQVLERLLAVREHHHTSNDVLQLPDVARPGVLPEAGQRLRRELLGPPVLRVEPREERRNQERNLLSPLPERGNADLDHIEAVVEVLAELATVHRLLQVAIRGGDHARVDIDQPVSPDAREAKVLEHVEELGLENERQLRDLVQVDGALVRVLELPRLPPMRAREGALLVAEELGLEQPLGNGGAVDLDEGPLAARGRHMDGAGDEILAHTALTSDQNGRVGVGNALDDGANRRHPGVSLEKGRAIDEIFHMMLRQRPIR